ncbi:MAG: hydrogenase expression/formation protein HypE [Bacillota bacterium]
MTAKIRLAEGGGGEATSNLIQKVFWSRFQHPELLKGNDAAVINCPGRRLAVSTDSFVVTPWRFPGGDIGKLAVCGTINDLTMMGAAPLGLTASFIIEEGFDLESLETIAQSMADAAQEAEVPVITGDTKVVNKGAADGIFINTTGVGTVEPGVELGGEMARDGDQVLITGTIGDHGAAVLMARGELGISSSLVSDVAPLNKLLFPIIKKYPTGIRVLRDPTRGGLAATLNEIARQSRVSICLSEDKIPVKPEVKGVCGLLGLDHLYFANEGKAILICDPQITEAVIRLLRNNPLGKDAAAVGAVNARNPGLVSIRNEIGGERILPMGSGEQLPRIC